MNDTRPSEGRRRGNYRDRGTSAAVLEAACRQFTRLGFDGASVDQIASVAGVTKATVYAKFGCKHDLYVAAIAHLLREFPSSKDLVPTSTLGAEAQLNAIATRLLGLALQPQTRGFYRMLIVPMPSAPHAGRTFWEEIVLPYRNVICQVLSEADRKGELHVPAPEESASQFLGLVLGGPTLSVLLSASLPMSADAQLIHAAMISRLFAKGHAPERQPIRTS
ncbi:hypothetical protein CSC62_08585 [Pseudoxanthomonas jiangsuensis]|uniref:TetR/AcrR family transcriptional regulator n=1 Tax=Pseudoxanthomonas jiangsuensis TaxID=619688 RepID=UPI001391E6BF|nr:TetR/AcrR family transcriptional regulator [Pseudoxanthomonas jiangsuensis]KAF1697249.1 hypothetical protein CSC62_08585 [Pseudoxanthomonas jiangsuensis]